MPHGWYTRSLLAIGLVIALGGFDVSARGMSAQSAVPATGVCMREGTKVVGKNPVKLSRRVRAPKKLRSADIVYPELPPGTLASGIWMGEVLVDAKGKVAHVWLLRQVDFTPPFPPFNQAIERAIRQVEYEPLFVKGEPTPFCLTTTVNINWK